MMDIGMVHSSWVQVLLEFVSTEEKHDQLLEKIYRRVGVNRDKFELKLSTMVNTKTGKIILPILCDGDVEFVLVNTECTPEVFVEVVERPVATLETVHVYQTPRKAIPMHPASFPKDAEDTAGGGNGKEGVGMPSECGTSRNVDKKRKRKSEGKSIEGYEAGNGRKLSNASEEEVKEVDPELLNYPGPEFSDFDKDRAENCFTVNQVWAIYDSCDGLPRYYAQIKKVFSPGFKLQITWLKPDPNDEGENDFSDVDQSDDEGENDCSVVDQPVACGKFTCGISAENEDLAMFSHQVLTDFNENAGIVVAYLGKVEGFVSVFHYKLKNGVLSFNIAPGEMYRFSHQIPSSRMTGKERVGVPEGSFELDPASLPTNDWI
ncbi:hypothetical protein LWI29_001362 [Acer saccharum]|uniref:DUF3444 domain-containing protein n=1 Tax=Acer saccharum TaxID=4024 RepID=A0AA39SZB0_ACESA|nr:hypothetical protein LWI29_001362 [Acer saccharum]